jgi:hypothetical protein
MLGFCAQYRFAGLFPRRLVETANIHLFFYNQQRFLKPNGLRVTRVAAISSSKDFTVNRETHFF